MYNCRSWVKVDPYIDAVRLGAIKQRTSIYIYFSVIVRLMVRRPTTLEIIFFSSVVCVCKRKRTVSTRSPPTLTPPHWWRKTHRPLKSNHILFLTSFSLPRPSSFLFLFFGDLWSSSLPFIYIWYEPGSSIYTRCITTFLTSLAAAQCRLQSPFANMNERGWGAADTQIVFVQLRVIYVFSLMAICLVRLLRLPCRSNLHRHHTTLFFLWPRSLLPLLYIYK